MLRVAGCDPGTSSLDLVVLENGRVVDQVRFLPDQLSEDVQAPIRWLQQFQPLDWIAGPSGYGLPLISAKECGTRERQFMSLVRPDERGQQTGIDSFSRLLDAFIHSGLPVVFLPGVIHLPTVPIHRKFNRIDLGTPDKLAVATLALAQSQEDTFAVVELGSAFTAVLVVENGRIVDGVGGTTGPAGWRSSGTWDGELAYLLSPLMKQDLFSGGICETTDVDLQASWLCEALRRTVAGMQAVTSFTSIHVSGKLLEDEPDLSRLVLDALATLGQVQKIAPLHKVWVKHAAQGAALLADGLAGGSFSELTDRLAIRESSGTVLDWLVHPKARAIQTLFDS